MKLYSVTVWHLCSAELPEVYLYPSLEAALDRYPPAWWAEHEAATGTAPYVGVTRFKELYPPHVLSVRYGKDGEWCVWFREHEI